MTSKTMHKSAHMNTIVFQINSIKISIPGIFNVMLYVSVLNKISPIFYKEILW